ncbi:capsular exopolysaccharide family [Bradyrhizobium lablabi]|uniref:non-specific protein-tyrosine kinase n=1 Tax=Bradyrhizobium lablabi TaxID=722472 RepID=A0A1M6MQ67_9BRAD|nr:polysaccharide biosynthesis tyrosine autokinase [Bradyrhizobium lablabi]SHJ85638.1 capsular exopolysaccharide family [Bradyrhizobium lablabi]
MDAPTTFSLRSAHSQEPIEDSSLNLASIIGLVTTFIRRQLSIFVFVIICCLTLGMIYLFTTPSRYTAHAMLLIDSSKVRLLQQQGPAGDTPVDTAQVETQVEILKSENIGLSVIKDLHLTSDPEFVGSGPGLIGGMLNQFVATPAKSDTQLERSSVGAFLRSRNITRVGRTYVLDIGYSSLSAKKSAEVANAIADAYVVDQLEAKYQATRRAGAWLQDRIKELRQQALDADRLVQQYKEKNKIIDVAGGTSTNGTRLLGEQQLSELNTQLSNAKAGAAEAKARYDRMVDVMKKDIPDASFNDSLHSDVINRLRSNYLDLAAKEAIWSARYGANHLAAVNLRTQMNELRRSINDELGRIAESFKNEYEVSKSRVDSLEGSLNGLISDAQVVNRDRLGLRELESNAQVYHTIYDNFLQRYMEVIQQQSFPITEARVISAATPPLQRSSPSTMLVLGLAGLAGLAMSIGIGILREAIDQVFRTAKQVEDALKTNCLAVLPKLSLFGAEEPSAATLGQMIGKPKGIGAVGLELASKFGLARQPTAKRNLPVVKENQRKSVEDGQLLIATDRALLLRDVVEEPLSHFAEGFRSIKVAADINGFVGSNKIIGVTSVLPNEGKTTVAANLAEAIAHAGKTVILIDGDLRNPTLSRLLSPSARSGLLEVLSNIRTADEVIYRDDVTGLAFMPAVLKSRFAHTNEILSSEEFKNLIEKLRKQYDYIIVDFPPVAPVVDVRAGAHVMDSFVCVVEWGRTNISLVQRHLLGTPEIYSRLLGVVLNKADLRAVDRYEWSYGKASYGQYYGHYGYS